MLIAPSQERLSTSTAGRRFAALVLAGVTSIGLALCAGIAGGVSNGPMAFLLFLVSLPWTVTVFVLTMVFNVTSPVVIAVVLVLITLLAWRSINRLLVRTCLSPREP